MQYAMNKLINMISADRYDDIGDYYKVILSTADDAEDEVWGFVVKNDDDLDFNRGDVLVPMTSDVPLRVNACGNVFDAFLPD